ncbi:MAG TPA: hypothetical protein VNA19_13160 [Pyrinomonadaceae bacterium]|jgi:hypothetical protein|nr:hypothetical protein [Pyrinomonadaceae bacterium]
MSLRRYTLLLVPIFLLTASVTTALRSQKNSTHPPASPPPVSEVSELDVPIADFNALEPADANERAKRRARGKRHNLRDKNLNPEDVARFALRENDNSPNPPIPSGKKRISTQQSAPHINNHDYSPPVVAGAITDHTPPETALPTHISDTVVIGAVTDANAYLSEDKTDVYSEFAVQVEEVLKSSKDAKVATGTEMAALRPGGGVRFPSGKVRKFLIDGRSLPRVGGRYALFLKYDDAAQAFYIVTGYELRNGKVFPLDGIPRYGSENHPFASYGKYINADEAAFLEDVRRAIVNPPQPAPGGYPIVPSNPGGGVR